MTMIFQRCSRITKQYSNVCHKMRAIIGAFNQSTSLTDTNISHSQTSSHRRWVSSDSKTDPNQEQEEVDKFSRIAHSWWDESGEFKALHTLNYLRIPLIRDGLYSGETMSTARPLQGKSILDVGCGGGLLSEPLSRLGGQVTGIDASADNVAMATWHASLDPRCASKITYQCCLVEELAENQPESFDGVVASEILEHVPNPKAFIDACCDLVKPGGSLFVTSLNKTTLSLVLGVFAAEQILRLVPKGAHDWNKFVPLQQLHSMLEKNNMTVQLTKGMMLNPLTLRWRWFPDTSINYAIHAVKKQQQDTPSSSDSDSD